MNRILMLTLAAAALAAPSAAEAGTYTVYSCKLPSGATAPTDGWTHESYGVTWSTHQNDCERGGAMIAFLSGEHDQAAQNNLAWRFSAPPGVTLGEFTVHRSSSTSLGYDTNGNATTLTVARLGNTAFDYCAARPEGCVGRGSHTSWNDPANVLWSGAVSGEHSVLFRAVCGSAYSDAKCTSRNSTTPMVQLRIHAFRAFLDDGNNPTSESATGSLLAPGPVKGTRTVAYDADDVGAGVYRTLIDIQKAGETRFTNVHHAVADTNGGRCQPVGLEGTGYDFRHVVPCKTSVSVEVPFDTTMVPDGKHELRVRVEDASGNRSIVHSGPIEIDNVPDAPTPVGVNPTPTPTAGPSPGSGDPPASGGGGTVQPTPDNGSHASYRARISMSGARNRRVGFGRRVTATVTLRDENGTPITNGSVDVLQRLHVPGAAWTRARVPLVTDGEGIARWVIPAGPSRTIRYAYRASRANVDYSSTHDVRLTVPSRSTLKTDRRSLRNGQTVRFLGRLLSRPVPEAGVGIELMAKIPGGWQTFRTTRTDGDGRWKASYRFRSTVGVQVYRFRARVIRDTGFPYAKSFTRSVRVKVTG